MDQFATLEQIECPLGPLPHQPPKHQIHIIPKPSDGRNGVRRSVASAAGNLNRCNALHAFTAGNSVGPTLISSSHAPRPLGDIETHTLSGPRCLISQLGVPNLSRANRGQQLKRLTVNMQTMMRQRRTERMIVVMMLIHG